MKKAKPNHLKLIKDISEGSKEFAKLRNKRSLIAHPNYLSLSMVLLEWSITAAVKHPEEQVLLISNVNQDKVTWMLEYIAQYDDEFREKLRNMKNLRIFRQTLDLTDKKSTKRMVQSLRSGAYKNRKIYRNGGTIVLDNIDEIAFPVTPSKVSSNKAVMDNLESLTRWHKQNSYELVMGTVENPVPRSLKNLVKGYFEMSAISAT